MRTLSIPVAILWAALTAALPAQDAVAKPDPNEEDLKRLQGEWELVSNETNGKEMPIQGKAVAIIRGQRLETRSIIGNMTTVSKQYFSLDADKNPKEVDTIEKHEMHSETMRHFYRFDEDRLVVCSFGAGVRPKAFDSKEGRTLQVFRRVKP